MKTMHRRDFIKKGAAAGSLLLMNSVNPEKIFAEYQATDRKIYIFSKHLQWLDYKETAKTARQTGFDGVDITVRPQGHVLPENVERDLPQAVEACRAQGLICDTITTGFTSIRDPHTETIIKTAARLGIKQYRMGWIEYNSSNNIEDDLKNFEIQLSELAQMNAHYGIRGDYQNHSGTSLGAVIWDIWHILQRLHSDWLGVRYDIRHAVVEGTQSWPLSLKTIAPFIRSLDIKDFKWQNNMDDLIINSPVGEGVVDFKRYIDLLALYKIPGNMTMHFEYSLGGAESGLTQLTVRPETVINAMRRDIGKLKDFLRT